MSLFFDLLALAGGNGKTQGSYRVVVILLLAGLYGYDHLIVVPKLDAAALVGNSNATKIDDLDKRLTSLFDSLDKRLAILEKADESPGRERRVVELTATVKEHTAEIADLKTSGAVMANKIDQIEHPPGVPDWRHMNR